MVLDKNKIVVVFAGPAGSSKTPIATYLSYTYNLPIFSTDAIRSEIMEDFLEYKTEIYKKLRDFGLKKVIKKGNSFILDASIDREWTHYKKLLDDENYQVFVISIDLSQQFLLKLYNAKIYKAVNTIEIWVKDHKLFLEKFEDIVNLYINEENFKDRLKISSENFEKWLQTRTI